MQLTDQYVLWYLARIFFHFYGKCAEFPSQYSSILQSAVYVCEGHWILPFYLVFLFDCSLLTPYVILFFFFFKLVMTCFPTCSACPHLLFFSPRMYISTRWILPWMQIFQIFDYSSHRTLDLVPSPVCSQNTPIVCCQMWLMLPLKKCRMSPAAYFMSSRFMYRLLT